MAQNARAAQPDLYPRNTLALLFHYTPTDFEAPWSASTPPFQWIVRSQPHLETPAPADVLGSDGPPARSGAPGQSKPKKKSKRSYQTPDGAYAGDQDGTLFLSLAGRITHAQPPARAEGAAALNCVGCRRRALSLSLARSLSLSWNLFPHPRSL